MYRLFLSRNTETPRTRVGDSSWKRICGHLGYVVVEKAESYTAAALRWQHEPPTTGRKDEEELAQQAQVS
eukprot:COSAG01_NODE_1235_length_11106_cov_3.058962_5_plen_70_part_00